jgi:hypothetical protein
MASDTETMFIEARLKDFISPELETVLRKTEAANGKLKASWSGFASSAKNANADLAKSADESFSKVSASVNETTSSMGKFTAAAMVAGGALAALAAYRFASDAVNDLMVYAEHMEKVGLKTGLTTDAVQELAYAADLTGTSIDSLVPGLKTLSKHADEVANGNKKASQEFKNLGVEIKDAEGKTKSLDEINNQVIERLASMAEGPQRLAEAMKFYGKAALDMMPIIAAGSEEYRKQREEAHSLGIVLDGELITKAAEMEDQMNRLNAVMQATKFKLVAPTVDVLTDAMTGLVAVVTATENIWRSQNKAAEDASDRLDFFEAVILGTTASINFLSYALKAMYEGFHTLGQKVLTEVQTLFNFNNTWRTLGYTLEFVTNVAALAWDAVTHPSNAGKDLQLIQGQWERYSGILKELKRENSIADKKAWEDFRKHAEENSAAVVAAEKTAKDSIKALANSFTASPEKKAKADGTGSTDDSLGKEAEKATALIELNEKTRVLEIQNTQFGLQKLLNVEQAHYEASLAKAGEDEAMKTALHNLSKQERLAITQKYTNEERDFLEQEYASMHAKQLADQKEFRAKQRKIDEDAAKARVAIERQTTQLQLDIASESVSLMQAVGGLGKTAFVIDKAVAAARIVVNTMLAESQALAQFGPIAGGAMIPWIHGLGALQLATVAATTIKGFEGGGFPEGRNTLIRVNENGPEAVLNARATASLGRPVINALNNGEALGASQPVNITVQGNTYNLTRSLTSEDKEYLEEADKRQKMRMLKDLKTALQEIKDYRI